MNEDQEAIRQLEAFRAQLVDRSEGSLGERAAILGVELADATDDMNDAIDELQARLRAAGVKPIIVGWDGERLVVNGRPLRTASRGERKRAPRWIEAILGPR